MSRVSTRRTRENAYQLLHVVRRSSFRGISIDSIVNSHVSEILLNILVLCAFEFGKKVLDAF